MRGQPPRAFLETAPGRSSPNLATMISTSVLLGHAAGPTGGRQLRVRPGRSRLAGGPGDHRSGRDRGFPSAIATVRRDRSARRRCVAVACPGGLDDPPGGRHGGPPRGRGVGSDAGIRVGARPANDDRPLLPPGRPDRGGIAVFVAVLTAGDDPGRDRHRAGGVSAASATRACPKSNPAPSGG